MKAYGSPRDAVLRPLLLPLLGLLVGCSTLGGGSGDEGEEYFPQRTFEEYPVQVEVNNRNWSAMHIYVVAGSQISSLGQISSQGTKTFSVPSGMMGTAQEIRLVADPIGSNRFFRSDDIQVRPGDLVEWNLTQPLTHSSLMIR